jgi:hypothetical protein
VALNPPYRLDPTQVIVNVHWRDPVTYNWSFLYVRGTLGGVIAGHFTPDSYWFHPSNVPSTSTNLSVAIVNVTTSTPTPPSVPAVPADSDFVSSADGWVPTGTPADQFIGTSPSGYGPATITNTTGGSYFVTVDTAFYNLFPPHDAIAGNTCTLDFAGMTLTNASHPGVTWSPAAQIAAPGIDGIYGHLYWAPDAPLP